MTRLTAVLILSLAASPAVAQPQPAPRRVASPEGQADTFVPLLFQSTSPQTSTAQPRLGE